MNRFSKFSWFLLIWTMLVIAWGTVVRATNSGAGCGNFWPLCGGTLIPSFEVFHTGVEFSHRVMSGLLIIFVFTLVVWGTRVYKNDPLRKKIVWSILAFTIIESILGAGLVLLGLVEKNDSVLRIFAVSIHLLNTFILLGVICVNAWWSNHEMAIEDSEKMGKTISIAYILSIATIGVTGAITALADTLFPSTSMQHTLTEQMQPNAHILVYLRIYHPILALVLGFLVIMSIRIFIKDSTATIAKIKTALIATILVQVVLGFANILLLTPLFVQVIHLVTADIIWLLVVILFLNQPKFNTLSL